MSKEPEQEHKPKAEGPPGPIRTLGEQFDKVANAAIGNISLMTKLVGTMSPMVFEWGRQAGREHLVQQLRDPSPN